MKKYIIRKAGERGKGVFAVCDIKKREHIIKGNLTKLKPYSASEITKHPKNKSDHWDEVGRLKFVLDYSPISYINHSCDPNCCIKYYTLKKKDIVAMRNIKKGEELTVDYSTGSIYGFGRATLITQGISIMRCKCKSKKCRKTITADFFKLPKQLQKKYYKNLPPSIKRKFKEKIKKLSD